MTNQGINAWKVKESLLVCFRFLVEGNKANICCKQGFKGFTSLVLSIKKIHLNYCVICGNLLHILHAIGQFSLKKSRFCPDTQST